MDLMKQGQNVWNDAYENRGNILFYPHEEIVRFINKFIRKRTGVACNCQILSGTTSEVWI